MPTRTLTVDLRDFRDRDLVNQEITVSLAAGDYAVPDAPEPGRFIASLPLSVWTDDDGTATISLIPTTDLVGRHSYTASVPGVGSLTFQMPDADTSLYGIVTGGSPDLPARQLPDPNAVPDGDTVISLSNMWRAGRFFYIQTTQPATPTAGTDALWINTGTTPATWSYWDGTAWQPFALQPNSATSAHIAPGSLVEADFGAGAVSTRVLADGSVTAPKLAADQPSQQAALRARINAEEAGHDHGTGGTALGDDVVTPAMLAADNAGQKQAFRARLDTASDVADGVVTEQKLADQAVSTAKIQNTAVTNQKIAGSAVDFRNLAPDSVRGAAIQAGAVGNSEIAAGAVERGNIHADVLDLLLPAGGSTGQVLKKQSATDGDADWEAETAGEDAATWAEQGNTDPIPRSKLPAEAFTQYTKEHTFTITVAVLGQANEGRGFDRVAGGGGSASGGGQFVLDGQTLTLVAASQLATGLVTIQVSGVLPANFRDRYWIIEDASGFHDVLRMRDASRYVREPGNTNYPAGLQSFQIIEWSAQATDIIFTRAVGSTFTLSLAVDPEEYLADQLAAHDVATAQIEDGAVTHPKLAANAVEADNLADDAVTQPKIADGAVGGDQLANDAVGTINIRNNAVTGSKLDSNSVATGNINNLAVTTGKIADNAVTEAKLADDIVARLNAMGGAGGQSDPTSTVQFVSLWRWSSTAPSTSELTGANAPTWGTGGWSNIPSGWAAPAATSGVGNRYRADTVATWNTSTNSFDLGTWSITEETGFNTEYTADPDARPLATTSNRVANSTHWRQRDPNTGHWPVIWNALYSGPENWTVLASVPIGVASKTETKIVTFTQPIRTRDLRFLAVQIDIRNPGLNQTDISASFILQPWNQLWPAPASDASNNYVSGASFVAFCGPAEIEIVSSQATLPGNISAAASNYFAAKWKFRGNTATGELQSVRFHEWAATGQSGYITFLHR